MHETKKYPIVVIMGPTASGKSTIAMELAEKISGEIVSADSMQCYKFMDIGTAKPTLEERKRVPHHLIDIFLPEERVEVYTYTNLMEKAIEEIWMKRKIAIISGGTGMYIKALLYGLDTLPSEKTLRESLLFEYENNPEKIRSELLQKDPAAYELYSNNPRRMIRALEVFILTGRSILSQNQRWTDKIRYNALVFKLKWERKELFKRIAERTENMLKSGWIEETEKLLQKNFSKTPTAKQAIGYMIISKYIAGSISYEEMKIQIISATKKYARRQETWFNNQHPEALEVAMPHNRDIIFNGITKLR